MAIERWREWRPRHRHGARLGEHVHHSWLGHDQVRVSLRRIHVFGPRKDDLVNVVVVAVAHSAMTTRGDNASHISGLPCRWLALQTGAPMSRESQVLRLVFPPPPALSRATLFPSFLPRYLYSSLRPAHPPSSSSSSAPSSSSVSTSKLFCSCPYSSSTTIDLPRPKLVFQNERSDEPNTQQLASGKSPKLPRGPDGAGACIRRTHPASRCT